MSALIDIACYAGYTVLSVWGLLLLKPALTPMAAGGPVTAAGVLQAAAGLLIYTVSFALWLVVLARQPLSVSYPVAIGLTLAASAVAAAWRLDEALPLLRIAGIVVIFAGVVMVARSQSG
jgi:multidrug transporter EmrE-like cation transporter